MPLSAATRRKVALGVILAVLIYAVATLVIGAGR